MSSAAHTPSTGQHVQDKPFCSQVAHGETLPFLSKKSRMCLAVALHFRPGKNPQLRDVSGNSSLYRKWLETCWPGRALRGPGSYNSALT